ncbi:MAG: hypothetical protein IPL99_20050 [Candidatus Competibacteraceae bacterium]|nr:hypothetical protein [Candidatus Competibacteraceae bacterium]
MATELATVSFQVSLEIHREIKSLAARRGVSIRELLEPELRRIIQESCNNSERNTMIAPENISKFLSKQNPTLLGIFLNQWHINAKDNPDFRNKFKSPEHYAASVFENAENKEQHLV